MTFEEVCKTEFKPMVSVATLIVGSQSIAEEAIHDAFITLHEHWFKVQNPGGFLRSTVVNRCKDLRRKYAVSERHLRLIKPEML